MNEMIHCPECDRQFEVVWVNHPEGGPKHCPFCGCVMDYTVAVFDAESGRDD